jgi:bifunctional UDP-N-acetylglucosamine pyrophosphorylase / glucosamine-1-phosphate N-acetyltransferase
MISALVAVNTGSRSAATLLTTMVDDPVGPARVERDEYGDVVRAGAGVVARELDTGIACFDGRALLRGLARLGSDDLRDLFELLADGGRVRAHVATDPVSCLSIDDQIDLARVRPFAQRQILARHLERGVTIVDPARTVVDFDVQIGSGTVLEPGCQLEGTTVLGRSCHVGPHTTLRDARLGDGVRVEHSVLVGCDLSDHERMDPFTYLRPDAAPARLRARAPQFA